MADFNQIRQAMLMVAINGVIEIPAGVLITKSNGIVN